MKRKFDQTTTNNTSHHPPSSTLGESLLRSLRPGAFDLPAATSSSASATSPATSSSSKLARLVAGSASPLAAYRQPSMARLQGALSGTAWLDNANNNNGTSSSHDVKINGVCVSQSQFEANDELVCVSQATAQQQQQQAPQEHINVTDWSDDQEEESESGGKALAWQLM